MLYICKSEYIKKYLVLNASLVIMILFLVSHSFLWMDYWTLALFIFPKKEKKKEDFMGFYYYLFFGSCSCIT